MSRQERVNMINFIVTKKEIGEDTLVYMTDADIEHIYNTTYFQFEETVE